MNLCNSWSHSHWSPVVLHVGMTHIHSEFKSCDLKPVIPARKCMTDLPIDPHHGTWPLSHQTSIVTVLLSTHYPPSSMILWWPGSFHLTNWVWWREWRHDNGTGEGWCDDGWKMGPGDTQWQRPQPLPVLHPQPDFAQCQLLQMLIPWHYSINSLRFTSFLCI